MKNKLFTLLFALLASVVTAFSQSFIGFEVHDSDLGTQIKEQGLIYDTINMTLVESSGPKYSINLVEAGEGTFKIGGITFYHNGQAGNTAFKTYGTYIQPNGNNREIRIPTVAGERVNVRLTEDCSGLLVNGVSTNLWAGDNTLTANGDSIVLKVADNNKPKISAILSTGMQTESTYTVFFRSPYLCDNTLPAVKGDFNNWGTPVAMHDTTDYWGDSYYTVTFDAMPDGQISYCNTAGDALMRYRYGEWMEVSAYTLNEYETEIYTYYDNDRSYRFGTCTPPAKHAVVASVLVPTDCGMDVTNGLYIYYWGEDSSNKQYMQMTAGEGRKFTATFDPNYFVYGYYFANGLDEQAEGFKRTYERTNLKADTLCWEVSRAAAADRYHSLEQDDECDNTDHNFAPYNLQAVNTSMDTVLFTWSVDTPMYAYNFRLYNEQGDQIYYKYVSSYNLTDNSYKDAVGLSEATHVAYWQLSAVTDNWTYYDATGEGFDIAGDTRRPHNLTVEETSEGVYTLRWEGEGVDHFHIIVNIGWEYYEYDTTALTYDLTIEDNKYVSVTVEGRSASEDSFGSVDLNFDTYKQDPRDITLYFYIPESAEFFNGAGGAIIWRDATMGGNHIVPLEADGENGHWYKAVVANFRRNSFRFTLMNGTTEETAMKFLEYNSDISQDKYFLLYTTQAGSQALTTSNAQNVYPHDYAVFGLHAEQYLNKMILSWSANEQASNYRIRIDRPDGSYYSDATSDTIYNFTELNNTDTVTMTWSVVPMGDWWNEYSELAVSGEFTAAPSPFIPKNLQAVNNNDGTFTFSWDPIPYDTVRYFYLRVCDARNSEVAYQSDIRSSSVTLPVNLLFSGKYTMNVAAMDNRYNYLGQATDTFEVAPVAPHDIQIRVLMNLSSTYDLSDGLKFRITKRPDSTFVVAATEERYGWWSYTLNTDQYGAQFGLENTYSTVRIYGDTCMEYTDYLHAVDCDARATDYVPHHLRATPNGNGTYNITWLIDMTDKVRQYEIEVQHLDSGWYDNRNTRELECNTSVLPYSGTYVYTVRAIDDNWNTLGRATDTIRIAPMAERTMTLRILEQPLEQGWSGYRIYRNDYAVLSAEDEPGNTGWSFVTIRSDQPAVHIELDSRWGEYTDFWMVGDTCIQVDNGFKKVACDAARQDFTPTNLHAESLGNGQVQFTWNCPDNPDRFYVQTLLPDSTPLTYSWLEGEARSYSALLNVDTTAELSWYLYAIKTRNNTNYGVGLAWGDTIVVEPSRYAPQNLQALDNNDGTYFVSWNALPDTVAYYQVRIQYPNGNRDSYNVTDTTFVTPLLRDLGRYYIYVFSMNMKHSVMGWQSVPVMVQELATPRDITVRVLLHPDSERNNPGSLEVKRADGTSDYIDAVAEANHWFAYTFSSTRLVQPIRLLYTDKDVVADTCFEFASQLKEAACDAVPHDYRITANSLQAVSEAGKVTFTWSAAEKSEQYEIYARYYYDEYGWWRTLFDETVTDTSYVYMVPANMDSVEIEWSVRPVAPHSLNSVDANNPVLLRKSQIVISNMLFTTTDSMTYHFAWQANTDTVQYEIQINQYYSDNWPVRQAQVATPSFDYTFISSDVTYGWQVRAVNAQGEPLSAWTVDTLNIRTKPGMKAITNIQGTAQGRTITFTWDSPTSVAACQLYYSDAENNWFAVIDYDSILYTNSFTYETTADGRYELILMPFVEVRPGEYAPLQERQWALCNVFTGATFSVNVSASTGGRVWDNPSGNYPAGFELWLDAIEEEHYRFVGWSDGNTEQNRLLVVSQDTTLVALFELRQEYTLTLDASAGGKLRIYLNEQLETTHYSAIHNEANSPWVEAIANEGYTFYRWSDGVTESNRTVRLNSDTTVTAIFMPICYATVTAGEGGRVQVTGGTYNSTTRQYSCEYGSSLTIKALPDEGYRFTGWSDGNTGVTRTIVITSDTVLTASFAESTTPLEQYVVRVSSNDNELGTVSNVSGAYYEGDQVTVTATPKENTYFVSWSDGNTDATRVITVSQDTTLIATFAYKRFTLVIRASEGGTVNDSTANGTYDYNSWVTITATPNEHYQFVQWSDGNTSATRSFNMTENVDLTATFAIEQFLVTFLNADGALIEANRWNYGQTPVCSTTPTMASTAEHNYVFIGWTPEIASVTGNTVYTAVYDTVARTYMITFVDEDGTVLSAREWEYGVTPTCAEPTKADDEQYTYTFAGWSPAVVAVTGEATYTATYTATKKPEGFEDVNAEGKAQKVIIDGTVYILRGDKIYTPTGAVVK